MKRISGKIKKMSKQNINKEKRRTDKHGETKLEKRIKKKKILRRCLREMVR